MRPCGSCWASEAASSARVPHGNGRQACPSRIARAISDDRDRRERDADLDDLVARDEVGRQLGEDLVELLGALGRVVLAAGRVGHGGQRLLVDRAAEAAARAAEAAAAEPGIGTLRRCRPARCRCTARRSAAAGRPGPPSRTRSCRRGSRGRRPAGRPRSAPGPALLAPSVSSTMMAGA